MKTLLQENGFEYSRNHRFGNPKEFLNRFQFLLSYEIETGVFDLTENVSYRITDDNYIQLCKTDEKNRYHSIIAQWELTENNMKEQLLLLLRDYFVGLLLFVGYPCQMNSGLIFTDAEFKALVKDAENEYDRLKQEAKAKNKAK
jgi:hypothetical protein